MGMYDTIQCKYPLPNENHCNLSFQTKDLENLLNEYTITEEGRLIHHAKVFAVVPEEEREYYGTEEWDKNLITRLMGSIESHSDKDIDLDYEGEVWFYTGSANNWIEYKATFVNGSVEKMEEIKYDEAA